MSNLKDSAQKVRKRARLRTVGALLAAVVVTGACEEPPKVDKNVMRTIKWMPLAQASLEQQRLISGVVKPAKVTALSFEVGGRVQDVLVDLGDHVAEGDVLAILDDEPFALAVRHAEAEVAAAFAVFQDESQELARQRKLFEDGWVAQAKIDAVQAGYKAADSRVGAMQARLDLARRDQRLAVLRAPFNGVISHKDVEAFEDVAGGQVLFELSAERDLEVAVRVPPSLINRITEGDAVSVTFPSEPGLMLNGTVTEVGSQAEEANAFPITVRLTDRDDALHPGLSAEVAFTFENETQANDAFTVPMTAILTGEGQDFYVFRYEHESSAVQRVAIEITEWRDNDVAVAGKISTGEVIVTAGVDFLTDGQTVRLMGEETPYGDGVQQ